MILLFLKIILTLWVIALVPTYLKSYGWQNFLWISDLGLALTFFGLWFTSPLLISTAAILTLPLDAIWTLDFLIQLITGKNKFGIVEYMFDPRYTLFTRGLSFFHVLKPIIWFYCLTQWGYNAQAIFLAVILIWILFTTAFFVTDPVKNINWLHLPLKKNWSQKYKYPWFITMLVAFPLVVTWPTHTLLNFIWG